MVWVSEQFGNQPKTCSICCRLLFRVCPSAMDENPYSYITKIRSNFIPSLLLEKYKTRVPTTPPPKYTPSLPATRSIDETKHISPSKPLSRISDGLEYVRVDEQSSVVEQTTELVRSECEVETATSPEPSLIDKPVSRASTEQTVPSSQITQHRAPEKKTSSSVTTVNITSNRAFGTIPESDNETVTSEEFHPTPPDSPRLESPLILPTLSINNEPRTETNSQAKRRRHRRKNKAGANLPVLTVSTTSTHDHAAPQPTPSRTRLATTTSASPTSNLQRFHATAERPKHIHGRSSQVISPGAPAHAANIGRANSRIADTSRLPSTHYSLGQAPGSHAPVAASLRPTKLTPEPVNREFSRPVIETSSSTADGQWSPFASGLNIELALQQHHRTSFPPSVGMTPLERDARFSQSHQRSSSSSSFFQNHHFGTDRQKHQSYAASAQRSPIFNNLDRFPSQTRRSPTDTHHAMPFGGMFPAFTSSPYSSSTLSPASTISSDVPSPVVRDRNSTLSPFSSNRASLYTEQLQQSQQHYNQHKQVRRDGTNGSRTRNGGTAPASSQFSLFDKRLAFSSPPTVNLTNQ